MSYDNFSTTDWVEDAEKENRVRLYRDQRYKGSGWKLWLLRTYSATQSWLVLAAAGAIIGLIAVIINIAAGLLADLRLGHCSQGWYLNKDFCCLGSGEENCVNWVPWTGNAFVQYISYILISVLMAGTACFLVLEYAPFAAGSGISEIKCIVAGFVMRGFLGFATLAIKSIALPLTVGSGFSVGKEGPSVHYAACVGNVVGRLFPKFRKHNSKRRELLTACTAAGVAVAFGSPVGGVLFSLEEISSKWDLATVWRSYFCCLVATGVLMLFNPFRTGKMVLFSVQYDRSWNVFEVPFFILVGVFGGLMGHFIIKWNLRLQGWRKKYIKAYPLQEIICLATITASLCYFNEFLMVDMTKSMQILFHECEHGWEHSSCEISKAGSTIISLIFAIVIRTFLVLISYGAKVPCGVFVPSLAIGALFGRLIGTIVWVLQYKFQDSFIFAGCPPDRPCVDPGTYAFLGAGALLSGVMHINITVVVIMFEITGALMWIIPSMIAVGVATLISSYTDEGGIADKAIIVNGFPFFTEEMEFHGVVQDVAITPLPIEEFGVVPTELVHSSYPIIDHDGFLTGSIDKEDLEGLARGDRFDPSKYTINRSPLTVTSDTKLDWVHKLFLDIGPRAVYVVENGILTGLVTRKDLLRFYTEQNPVPPSEFGRVVGEYLEYQLIPQLQGAVDRFNSLFSKVPMGSQRIPDDLSQN